MESRISKGKYFPWIYYSMICVVMLGVYMVTAGQLYGIFFPPDEYGYWANAAAFLGRDWSEVSALQSYYSFGYSLLLVPLMGLIKDTVLLYRAAVFMNVVLACLHGILLYRILARLFPETDRRLLVLAGSAGAFYPSILVYSHYTLAEVLLNLMFLLLACSLFRFLERPGTGGAVLLGLAMGYTYFVHMRSVGILAALLFVTGIMTCHRKELRKYFLIMAVSLILCLMAGAAVKGYLYGTLYRDTASGLLGKNNYHGQFGKLGYLLSPAGFLDFCVSFMGKLFYLGNTTFCVFYWGMYAIFRESLRTARELKNRGEIQAVNAVYLFLAGSVAFTCLISAFYMIYPGRVDSILYGRYNEAVIPVVVCIGIIEMFRTPYLKKGTFLFVAFHAACATMLNIYISVRGVTTYLADFAVGIAYAAGMHPESTGNIINYPYIIGGILSVTVMLVVYGVRIKKLPVFLIGILAVINLCVGIRVLRINVLPHQRDNRGDMAIAETIGRIGRPGREIYLLHSEWNEYIDVIQYYLPDKKINVISENELDITQLGDNDIILLYRPDGREGALEMLYDSRQDSYHLKLFFNEMGADR